MSQTESVLNHENEYSLGSEKTDIMAGYIEKLCRKVCGLDLKIEV